ncbi:MAG TPA: ABC transporter permease, partial [Candidatus Marinimicrobia bacterium]|nr:ABC transporter permease [Candidatus Neomarinimicrobiota bacterium]
MNISTYIAKRFLLGERGVGASRFTGLIAIAGMAVGCFALILSIAVLNGFEKKVTAKIRGFEGDLRVSGASLDFIDIQKQLDEEQSVLSYMPFMERKGLVIGDGNILRIATLKAVDMNKISSFYQLGLSEIELNPSDFPIIIGQLLASRLNLAVGDYVKLMSPVDHPSRFGLPRKVQVKVVGVFQGNVLDYDDRLVFVPLSVGK